MFSDIVSKPMSGTPRVDADSEKPPANKTSNPLSSNILALIGSWTPGTIIDLSPFKSCLSLVDVFIV